MSEPSEAPRCGAQVDSFTCNLPYDHDGNHGDVHPSGGGVWWPRVFITTQPTTTQGGGRMIKVARYRQFDGRTLCVEYDTEAPCRICGLPTGGASMGGTNVCSWCDCGYNRDGTKWDMNQTMKMIGPTSPAALALKERPLKDLDENDLPPGIWFEPAPQPTTEDAR